MAAGLFERCIHASEVCAAACEAALAADDSYTSPGTSPYSEFHLALVSCQSVCSLVVKALQTADGDLALLRWCVELCSQCAADDRSQSLPEEAWSLVVRASIRCSIACQAVIEHVLRLIVEVIDVTRGTDFQQLEA